MTPEQLKKFETRYAVEPNTGCWLWIGFIGSGGYGRLCLKGAPSALAHRLAYLHFKGPVGPGLDLDHLCRQRCCVNPDHLEPVSRRENCRRGVLADTQRALAAARLTCRQGHPYDDANTYVSPSGVRSCRKCHARNQLSYTDRKKAKYGQEDTP